MVSSKADVIPICGADWPPEQILRYALEADMDSVVVVGWLKEPDADGKRFWCSSSYYDRASVIYALQQANLSVLEATRQQDE